jgi:hypothetical protein
MAPGAGQGAAFQKHRGPDAGSVMQGEFFYIENMTLNCHTRNPKERIKIIGI